MKDLTSIYCTKNGFKWKLAGDISYMPYATIMFVLFMRQQKKTKSRTAWRVFYAIAMAAGVADIVSDIKTLRNWK